MAGCCRPRGWRRVCTSCGRLLRVGVLPLRAGRAARGEGHPARCRRRQAWGHDLAALVAAAAPAVGPSWPSDLGAPAERLSRFYIATRYPDAVPGGVPGDRFTADDAASAESDARRLFAAVDVVWADLVAEASEADEQGRTP